MYREEDYIALSGIQHFAFCRRQWALIHIEQQWEENLRTVEGNLLHKNAHDASSSEKRGDIIISRGMPIHSSLLGTSGECDVVEFHRNDMEGITLFGRVGRYLPIPIEYKHGEPKAEDMDILQLTAQAICLEEMLCCEVKTGYIFYEEIRRRITVEFTEELHHKAEELFEEMHQIYQRRYTPKVKSTKACNACSLKNLCLPILNKSRSVKDYIANAVREDEHEEAT
ncbi:MAG: CRISPR-associated protein Cas4 [Lachnospiraceae bacterium]